MRRVLREILYDLREPGIHIWMIPIVALLFIALSFLVEKSVAASGAMNIITLSSLEILIPSIGGYGAIMLMQGILDVEGGEIAFTYRRKKLYWGVIRQLRFFILFAIIVAVVCISIADIMRIQFNAIFPLTLAQCFAVMAVAFFGITLSRKVESGLIILVAFVGIQLTLGREYPMFNFIYILAGTVPSPDQANNVIYNCLIIGSFSFGLGKVWIRC